MRRIDIIKRAGRNLRQSKGRTILTSLAISVGAFTIGLALMAGEGGRLYTNSIVDAAGDKKVIMVAKKIETEKKDQLPEYGSSEQDAGKNKESAIRSKYVLNDKDLEKIRQTPHVKTVTPAYSTDGVAYAKSSANNKKFALTVAVKMDRTRAELAAGSLEDFMPKPGEIIIPDDYVKQLGFKDAQSAIGQTITLGVRSAVQGGDVAKEVSFKIAAVDKKSDTVLFYEPMLRISTADAKAIYEFSHDKSQPHQYSTAIAMVDDESNVDAAKDVIGKAFSQCEKYEKLLSKTKRGSDIYKINHAAGKAVQCDGITIEVIKKGLEYSKLTNGKFDITIGKAQDTWDFHNHKSKPPAKEKLAKAMKYVDYKQVKVNGNKVQMGTSKGEIDLGAVAKGYIADGIAKYLKEQGVTI